MNQSGLLLFLKCAAPCLSYKVACRITTEKQEREIGRLLQTKTEPTAKFIECCFAEVVNDYRQSCGRNSHEADFSFESVVHYWANHGGETPMQSARIISLDNRRVKAVSSGDLLLLDNPYQVPLNFDIQVRVWFHGTIIICAGDEFGAIER